MATGIPICSMYQIYMNRCLNVLFNNYFYLFLVIIAYQIYVVKLFYDFEVTFLAAAEKNVLQPTLCGPTYVTLPSQIVQNPTFPVQPVPYVIQQVQQPLTQLPYLQQKY